MPKFNTTHNYKYKKSEQGNNYLIGSNQVPGNTNTNTELEIKIIYRAGSTNTITELDGDLKRQNTELEIQIPIQSWEYNYKHRAVNTNTITNTNTELDGDLLSVYGCPAIKYLERPWNKQRAQVASLFNSINISKKRSTLTILFSVMKR